MRSSCADRDEAAAKVSALRSELESSSHLESENRRDASSLSNVQSQLARVQTEWSVDRTTVSELMSELAGARSQLHDWEARYTWQYQAGAGANEQLEEDKNPSARRLIPVAEDEVPKTPPSVVDRWENDSKNNYELPRTMMGNG